MSVQWGNPEEQAERMAHTYNNGTGKTVIMKAQNHHLALAAKHIDNYEERINLNGPYSSERKLYEDRAYKKAMMHAAYAQAEAATRQAEALESILELAQEGNK